MTCIHEPNQKTTAAQAGPSVPLPREERLRRLRIWRATYGITWVEMGRHMTGLSGRPVSGSAVQKAMEGERMPEDNHAALLLAYPHLPVEFLPRPENTSKTFNQYKQPAEATA